MKEEARFYHRFRRKTQDIIKVGFLGDCFWQTPIERLNYAFLGIRDDKISRWVFALNEVEDEITLHLKEQTEGWEKVFGKAPVDIAKRIYASKIDVLIALSDNEMIRKVLSLAPAPIALAGGGGVSIKDANLADVLLGDKYIQSKYGDTVEFPSAFCYLPFFGNTAIRDDLRDNLIFGAFYHENDKRMEHWKAFAEILTKLPTAKLRFFSDAFNTEKNKIVAKKRLAWAGIDENRVELAQRNADTFEVFNGIDIFLDAYPNGESVALADALYMGVPVVSATNVGQGVLNAVGLGELWASDEAAYVNSAVALASDNELRAALRTSLRGMMENSTLMDREVYGKYVKLAVFAAFDYLTEQDKTPPTEEETKILWKIFDDIKYTDKENKLAIADRLLLTRPTDKERIADLVFAFADTDIETLQKAAEMLPDDTIAGKFIRFNLAKHKKDYEEAEKLGLEIKEIATADENDENFVSATLHMLADMYKSMGRMKDAAEMYRLSAEKTKEKYKSNEYDRYSNYVFTLNYTDATPKELLEAAKGFNECVKNLPRYTHVKRKNKKIKVGYISPDFRNHVVACFALAFFQARDAKRFETFAYMLKKPDPVTEIFKTTADNFRDLSSLKYDEIAKLIYEDKIDILVDLAGHTGYNPLPIMARKPAPIQMSGIGYFSPTGLREMDYFIVDEHTAPPGEEENFTEKLIRLPHSHFCYTYVKPMQERDKTLAFEKNGFITFGSMNNSNKLNDNVLKTWRRILENTPDSKLFLKFVIYDDPYRLNKEKTRMEKMGIDLNRVIFEGFSGDYLKGYNLIDIALDPYPYPGGGTTCDALMMGVPVITLSGKSNHERFGKSILCNLNLEELVAYSEDEYIDIAVKLANDKDRLKRLHEEIPSRMKNSAIMDQKLYMTDLEAVYEKVYQKWLES
ncbi:MAG: hypothetical protein J6O04_00820 [Selenomonadaceae bacterium]|nr:hypothetical protein [Selenomonadaceae bacterium]